MDLKARLEDLGYNILGIVTKGEEALKIIEETKPDLILMDIIIKGELDGIKAAQIIKDNCKIPFIYLTAHYDNKTLERAQKTQPSAYLKKPYNDTEIQNAIELALIDHQLKSKKPP
ncbi:response regulator [Methanobacterium sp. SMA-27]|uniref:response regulator n=1 Tax=Methanobacterium sp. SMA-27 TaxID=1495336 RepID=UPI0009DE2D66|nr:response regulator [Methanobacterium sp. SMA-27]